MLDKSNYYYFKVVQLLSNYW